MDKPDNIIAGTFLVPNLLTWDQPNYVPLIGAFQTISTTNQIDLYIHLLKIDKLKLRKCHKII